MNTSTPAANKNDILKKLYFRNMQFSVIIPTLNEADNIGRLVKRLRSCGPEERLEILVVDANSTDDTTSIAEAHGAKVLPAIRKGRSHQMNQGAAAASGEILYFVHGDTLPPESCLEDIQEAIKEGYPMGCFRFRFNTNRKLLLFNSYLTRFGALIVRGGDQSMFIPRQLFHELEGFRSDYRIMEDFEFIVRTKKKKIPFKVIQKDILVSARKYDKNSYLRVQIANGIVFSMFRLGFGQDALCRAYKRLLRW